MNTDWKSKIENIKIMQKCPRCNALSLKFIKGRLLCSECGYEQQIGDIS